jgi:hypothetical protein
MLLKNKEDGSVITVPCMPKFKNIGVDFSFHPVSFDQVKELKEKQNEQDKK